MKFRKTWLFSTLVITLALAACTTPGPQPEAQLPTPAQTAAQALPTATVPPTPEPTATPLPSPTPTLDPNYYETGGTVIIGTSQEPTRLNPLLATSTIEEILQSLVIEGLVGVDAAGNYVPVLAEALPTVSEDGLQITYQLRQGIVFSNNEPFICADVQYTLEAIRSAESLASTAGYDEITAIECPSDFTAVVALAHVYTPYLELFSYILPRSAGDLAQIRSWTFNQTPIGTGPWIVSEWLPGDHITLLPNPTYRQAGKPYLDSLLVKILPSREAVLQLLASGEITLAWELTEADFPALDGMPGVTVASALDGSGENEALVFNLADPSLDAPTSAADYPHPILSDVRVRQAIQFAIDKPALVQNIFGDRVRPSSNLLPAGPFACPQEPSPYSPEQAATLLEQAGWQPGSDGIRVKEGVRLSLQLAIPAGSPLQEATAQALVQMLQAAGVELTVDPRPAEELFASWDAEGRVKHGHFDLLLYTTGAGTDPDRHLFANYHALMIPSAMNDGSGSNFSRYANTSVDGWINAAATTTNFETRHLLYCQVAGQVAQDLPRLFLYERLILTAQRAELHNLHLSPGSADFTIDSQNWWLKQ